LLALCSFFRDFEASLFAPLFASKSSLFWFICCFHQISFLIHLFEVIRGIF
jgi:hypothetical protein